MGNYVQSEVEVSMIKDSIPWKDSLLSVAQGLEKRKSQTRWSERSLFLFERDVMTAAYAVRKLIEARRVSDALAKKSWPLVRYVRTGPVPDAYNSDSPEELFEMSSPVKCSLSTLDFTHQIIHSYLFFPVWDWDDVTLRPRELKSLSFVSDKRRHNFLYAIDIDVLIGLLHEVGDEDVISYTIKKDENGERNVSEVIGVGRGDPRHWSAQPQE